MGKPFIAIMQGRLVQPEDGRFQSFPRLGWESEFERAASAGLNGIEWIYDDYGKDCNPLFDEDGLRSLKNYSQKFNVAVRSVCADYYMDHPILREDDPRRKLLLADLEALLDRCSAAGIKRVVLPFVDASRINSLVDEDVLVAFLEAALPAASRAETELHLETDLDPRRFALLLARIDHPLIKVNYDSGNSASLGYDCAAEFEAYGHRIGSVHIKDRALGGGTVPLGAGNANLPQLFREMASLKYAGDLVLQVARTAGDEVRWAAANRALVEQMWSEAYASAPSAGIDRIFSLDGRVAIITGGAGLLGRQHALAIARAGGVPVLIDVNEELVSEAARIIRDETGAPAVGICADITSREAMSKALERVVREFGRVDILINNAANNPKMEKSDTVDFSRLENFPLHQWQDDISVGLTGAFICSQVFGAEMARRKSGVILNIASDLAIIGPDQRLYRDESLPEHLQPAKPVTYSVVKSGLLGLTRYLATYWAADGVRINSISPGGVENGQPEDFVARLTNLIPMKRMANISEYQGAIIFLCSDASSYMTGTNVVVDGGRTCW